MSDLSEFLLARIAEDEAVVVAILRDRPDWEVEDSSVIDATPGTGDQLYVAHARGGYISRHIARWDPARVLAECEAKRRIVTEVHHRAGDGPRGEGVSDWQKDACEGCGWGGPCDDYHVEHINGCPTLRFLALPYADHPDYREEWRP